MEVISFHQAKAPEHKLLVSMAVEYNCGCELFDHIPYFPDLASDDYELLSNMKKYLAENQYHNDDVIISAVSVCFLSTQ